MKEKYWFAILMVTFRRMEFISYVIYLYSEICHKHPNFRKIGICRKIYVNALRQYDKLSRRRDATIDKCKKQYWNWIERPFLVK